MKYNKALVAKVNLEEQTVKLSVRLSETVVITYVVSLSDFQNMIGEFRDDLYKAEQALKSE